MESVGISLARPFGIPAKLTVTPTGFTVPLDTLPRELITGDLRCKDGSTRCSIHYKGVVNQGTYGKIERVRRTDASGSQELICKRPSDAEPRGGFLSEALVQWISGRELERIGIYGAIPSVYDIYRYGDEVRFTMDYVNGISAYEAIYRSSNPDETLLLILAQISLILGVLESGLQIDHRDIKLNNLWIRPLAKELSYTVKLGERMWQLFAPFQVVLLDFGFACIGDSTGRAAVNMGEVFPDLDPCPKTGRNLFQCILSLWSVPQVLHSLSQSLRDELEGWLRGVDKTELEHAKSSLQWTFMITGTPTFSLPALHPLAILYEMAQRWPSIVGYV
jgi:serine/threonine protein kinase